MSLTSLLFLELIFLIKTRRFLQGILSSALPFQTCKILSLSFLFLANFSLLFSGEGLKISPKVMIFSPELSIFLTNGDMTFNTILSNLHKLKMILPEAKIAEVP